MTDTIISIISSLGFPIFVACWFMFFGKKSLDANTAAIVQLKDILEKVCNTLDYRKNKN